jgi:hypothetical protein
VVFNHEHAIKVEIITFANIVNNSFKMKESEEIIMLRVKKSKANAFRRMLKLFDFVKLETPEDRLDRYLQSAPKNVPISDDDIMKMIKSH